MSTVFGALDANDESQRRVPQPGSSLIPDTKRQMARDLRDGTWDPIGDDLLLRSVPADRLVIDTTPTAIELLSRED